MEWFERQDYTEQKPAINTALLKPQVRLFAARFVMTLRPVRKTDSTEKKMPRNSAVAIFQLCVNRDLELINQRWSKISDNMTKIQ
ncbi:jg3958, partial [Pararge aegeria aegeria]